MAGKIMDKEEKKKLRKQLMDLLNNPNADQEEIRRIGKLLGGKEVRVPTTKRRVYTKKHVDPHQYIEWRKQKKSQQEIADLLGIHKRRLQSELTMLREKGLLPKGFIGLGNNAKFTMTKEEYLKGGLTRKEILKKYNIKNSTFSGILRDWGLTRTPTHETFTYEEYCKLKKDLRQDREIEKMKGWTKCTLYRLKKKWAEEARKENV